MKAILLAINPDPALATRVRSTASLAQRVGGHISCIQVIALPLVVGDASAMIVPTDYSEAAMKQADEVQALCETLLSDAQVSWTWIRKFGDASQVLLREARLADLIVLGATGSYPPVAPVAVHARVPILALPSLQADFSPSAPALIAWNGSGASANALRHAVPLVAASPAVHLLTIGDEEDELGQSRAADYLRWHGIEPKCETRKQGRAPVSEIIVETADHLQAGLLVAGAFGHNRIREMLLGSVTRALLKGSGAPLLLAH